MATKNPNAGKPGYDKYGVKLMSQRRKEEQAAINRKKFIESRNARDKKIKDNAAQKAQVEKIKETIGFSDSTSLKPASSKPKRKKQSVASAISSSYTDAKVKKLDTSIKGENIKAKKERNLSESDQQKLAKLQKMKDKADKRQNRKDKSIERLAFRMGEKATFQDAAALKQKRSQARKDYLRNFASQLARGEQAAPRVAFGETDDNPNNNTSLAGASEEKKAKAEQADTDQKFIYSSVNTFNQPNSGIGLGVTPTGGVGGENFGADSMSKVVVPDLTPTEYIQQEYRKKRG